MQGTVSGQLKLLEEFCLPGDPPQRRYLSARLNRHPKTIQRMEKCLKSHLNIYRVAWEYQLENCAGQLSSYQCYCLILVAKFFVNHRGEIAWTSLSSSLKSGDARFSYKEFKKVMEELQ